MFDIEDHYPDFFDDEDYPGGFIGFIGSKGKTLVVLKFERIVKESEKAWLVEFPMDDELNNVTCWLPKSQCKIRLQDKQIQVPQWLVEEKELEDYQDETE